MRRKRYLEHDESKAFYQWFCLQHPKEVDALFHVPNERHDKTQKQLLAAIGVTPGVSDYILLYPAWYYHGLVMEMKATGRTWGAVTQKQRRFLLAASKRGYVAMVAFGFDQACEIVDSYLGKKRPNWLGVPYAGLPFAEMKDGTIAIAR